MQLPEKSISDWRNSKGYTTGRPIINSAGEKPVALLGSHLKICKALWRTVPSQLSPNFSAQNIIILDKKESINELIALISTGAIETVHQCLDFSPLLVFYNRSNTEGILSLYGKKRFKPRKIKLRINIGQGGLGKSTEAKAFFFKSCYHFP